MTSSSHKRSPSQVISLRPHSQELEEEKQNGDCTTSGLCSGCGSHVVHHVLLFLSGFFLIIIATLTEVLFALPPSNGYLDIDFDVLTRNPTLTYFCTALVITGLLLWVILIAMLLYCHSDQTHSRTLLAVFGCLGTGLVSLVILLGFAIQPSRLAAKILPAQEALFEPIKDSYFPTLATVGLPGNEDVTHKLKSLQDEQGCCLYYGPEGKSSTSCLVLNSRDQVLKHTQHCTEYFYEYYSHWVEKSSLIVRIVALMMCVGLVVVMVIQVVCLARECDNGYLVNAQQPGNRLKLNLGRSQPVPYVYFANDEMFKGNFEVFKGPAPGLKKAINVENQKEIQGPSPLCVMPEY